MAPTIEDLFEFLKKDKIDRALGRETDKAELKELIRDGVKKEVLALINPIEERVAQAEKNQNTLCDQFSYVQKELVELKKRCHWLENDLRKVFSYKSLSAEQGVVSEIDISGNPSQANKDILSSDSELSEIISLGRRTIGLYKIDESDLQRMRQDQYGGAKSEEEARLLAATEYLRCELKIDSDLWKDSDYESGEQNSILCTGPI